MRHHGLNDFPDPHVTTGRGHGSIVQGIPAAAAASPKFKSAQKACRGIIGPPGEGGPSQSQQQARKRDLLAFAGCMRARGITDFPDPTSAGRLTLQMLSSAGVDIHSRRFLTAGTACAGVTHGAITAAEVASAVNGGP